jgi:hypothetical protein
MLQDFLFQLRKRYGNFIKPKSGCGNDVELKAILPNQSQIYIDLEDYLEACTPECSSIRDLVVQERVTKAIIRQHLKEFNENLNDYSPSQKLYLFASSTDAFRKLSNGAHENYQFYGPRLIEQLKRVLPTFLIARTILEGTGLFCIKTFDGSPSIGRKISFCPSQRINFMRAVFSNGTTGDGRPLISDKGSDPLVPTNYNYCHNQPTPLINARLHIIKGEHNQTPFGNFIKMGSVSLLIDMVEAGYFQNKHIPHFELIKNNAICCRLTELIDRDLDCQRAYAFDNFRQRMRLCDILDIYAEWMLDFLRAGDYRSDSSVCDRLLYLEKLEVAKQLKRAADCFARDDIFALVGDVEWITKIWWFRDWLETEYNLKTNNDDLKFWTDFNQFLSLICRDKKIRSEIIDKILWKDLFWHSLDSSESDYAILEESGLINPLVIDGQEVDLSTDGRFNEAPQNPPNRSSARKKLWDFMHKIGLKDFLMTDWARCWIITRDSICMSPKRFYDALKYPPACPDAYKKFPWGKSFYFEKPEENDYSKVDDFIKNVKEIIHIND